MFPSPTTPPEPLATPRGFATLRSMVATHVRESPLVSAGLPISTQFTAWRNADGLPP